MDLTVEELAARQVDDYRRVSPGTYFGERHEPLSIDESYQVQAAVSRLRVDGGDKIAGFKLGCTSEEIKRQFGLSGPIHAALFASELRRSGARLSASSFANLAIEGEMAVRIDASARIMAAFPIIELHNFIFRGEPKTLSELIVNNGLNAGVVLPAEETSLDLLGRSSDQSLRVLVNGKCVDEGNLWCLPGGAAASVNWLKTNLRRYDATLAPGHLILTGTPLGIHRVQSGDHIEVAVGSRHYVQCFVQ